MPRKRDDLLTNFLPINRKFFEHPLWAENRIFSKAEAWLDLIRSARFEESEAKVLISGKLIRWSRGQLPASLRFLGERWRWSKNKVDDFLGFLEGEGMIRKNTCESQTILTLVNYDVYNQKGLYKGQEKGALNPRPYRVLSDVPERVEDRVADGTGTKRGQGGDKTNKVDKVNKEEDVLSGTYTPEQEELFKRFQEWVSKNAGNVARMEEPFTIGQYVKMREKFSKERVRELLMKMHNWKPLLQKNNSAYLTLMNWSRRDFTTTERNHSNVPTNNVNEKLKAAGKRNPSGHGSPEDAGWAHPSPGQGA